MGQLLLFIVVALVVAAIVFGVTVMVSGGDSGLTPVEPDGKALPLPVDRPLGEDDVARSRFDTAFRGYRMAQVDQALQRAAYDIGYKNELIGVLEAEVTALRDGRTADADALRRAREASVAPPPAPETITKSDGDTPAPLGKVAPDVSDATKDVAAVPAQAPAQDAAPGEKPVAAEAEPDSPDSADGEKAVAGKAGAEAGPGSEQAGSGKGTGKSGTSKQAERR